LPIKYKVKLNNNSQNVNAFLSSNLYKVLNKIDNNILLNENDLNFLKKRKLNETIDIACEKFSDYLTSKIEASKELTSEELQWIHQNQKNEILLIGELQKLKQKYKIADDLTFSSKIKLFTVLKKLDKKQRLNATDIVYLEEKRLFYPNTKIYKTYHRIEAEFYEAEYKENKNLWNLPNISSHWRKADQSQKALESTSNINFDTINDKKLKSAILTTRGGAFRDLSQLNRAEKCAKQAIKFQPSSHHPYTLMGAIYFDRGNSYEGHKWFEEAEKRGATPASIDAEIKKSISKIKDKNKRNKIIQDLLKRDKHRYRWAKIYLAQKDR
jgi:hypothetical protein